MNNSFGKNIIPSNEINRLQALRSFAIMDTAPEVFFNNLAHMAAQCFGTPIALVSIVDSEQVFFKAQVGMDNKRYMPRAVSLCSLAVLDNKPTIFEDTLQEPCLLANPLVAGSFGLRFYAGAPIRTPDGYNIGTLCVVDQKPRQFLQDEQDLLIRFADAVMEAMLDRRQQLQTS